MVFYEFYFRPEGEDENASLRFSILIISDTGYFCAEDETLAKSNVAGFLAADESSTKVAFILSDHRWDAFSFTDDKKTMKTFLETGGELPEEYAAKGIYGKCVNVARLASEEEANVLLDELVVFAQSNGIPLKRIISKS